MHGCGVVRSRNARRRYATANGDVQLCGVGRSDSSRSSAARSEETGGCGLGGDVQGFRWAVLAGGTALDCARTVTAGVAAAGVLFGAQRAAPDGAAQLQLADPLVRGLGDRRRGVESRDVQQEARPTVEPGSGAKVFRPCERTGGGIDVGRALHGGWDADRGLGGTEELSPQGRRRVGERRRLSRRIAPQPDARLAHRPGSAALQEVGRPGIQAELSGTYLGGEPEWVDRGSDDYAGGWQGGAGCGFINVMRVDPEAKRSDHDGSG